MAASDKIRTTVTFDAELYAQVRQLHGELGYRKMGDLVNEAVRQYLSRQRTLRKDQLMQEAARDEAYRAVLREISEEFAEVDAEGLQDY